MMKTFPAFLTALLFLSLFPLSTKASESPFQGTLRILEESRGEGTLLVEGEVKGPPGGKLFPKALVLSPAPSPEEEELPGFQVELLEKPPLEEDGYYPGEKARFLWRVTPIPPRESLWMGFQGCVDTLCYMPQWAGAAPQALLTRLSSPEGKTGLLAQPLYGYADKEAFIAWLSGGGGKDAPAPEENLLERVWGKGGWLLTALLTVGLGFLLNLTPCVLPMIPVTLGVLGARGAGFGRLHGACLGGIYGGAMAVTYGLGGAAVVAFGGHFGALQGTPLFQFSLALVFLLLGLSLLDCFLLDFSRFRKAPPPERPRGSFLTAAILGASAALLAGACVAPVLLWVLFLSARLYGEGHAAALWLPLLLGIGLGAPWPLLGAGLGSLPPPGKWMNLLRKAMGLLILGFALQSALQGVRLLAPASPKGDFWREDYAQAWEEARQTEKPILLYFWGAACKACHQMEKTTFQDEAVRQALEGYVCLDVQGDQGEGKRLAEQWKVPGFPTFLLLSPEAAEP